MKPEECACYTHMIKNIHRDDYEDKIFIEKTSYDVLKAKLDRIGLLASSEIAYTKDFTTEVMGIVRGE